jgi:aryl-alcohol dehydrogenase-like predicted oxidoreductase
VTGNGMVRACEGSLARLGTDHLDLYLLHWPVPNTEFSHLVAGFEKSTRGGQNSFLGRIQLLSPPNGRPIPYCTRRSLRDQSGPL